MKEEIVYTASKIIGFTPLELVLMTSIGIVVTVLWRFVLKQSKESSDAINNNTLALNKLSEGMVRKIRKATKP